MARLKNGTDYGASRAAYMGELIAEQLTGIPTESYQSQAMKDGTAKEPQGKATYAFQKGFDIDPGPGFVMHPTLNAGASPDGFVLGDKTDGLIELKCPLIHTHLDRLIEGRIDKSYLLQMQFQMACVGPNVQWCDFVSYCPELPPEMQLWVMRVPRIDNLIKEIEGEVVAFLLELDTKVEALRKRYPEVA